MGIAVQLSLLLLRNDKFKPAAVKRKVVRMVRELDSLSYKRNLGKFCLFSLSKLKVARTNLLPINKSGTGTSRHKLEKIRKEELTFHNHLNKLPTVGREREGRFKN